MTRDIAPAERDPHPSAFKWWRNGIVYQVYPRSFQDSDGDGIGDLNGIVARLDHLTGLGVDAVWISPFYPSPMADFGYDVADHCDIDPMFGAMAQFERLLEDAHERGLKVILDYVPNHTSDRHAWFLESRASRDNPKRDWYIWRDPAPDGGPPNNWLSEFGGSAWQWDDATGQYYYHAYLKEQPDLNWRNAELREAMLDVLRFWLERGVDGFRVDAIHQLIEDDRFRDNPPNPEWRPGMPPAHSLRRIHTMDLPEVHDAIRAMREVADAYPGDRVLIGEAYLPIDRLMAYYGDNLTGFQLPFNFHLILTPWDARSLGAMIELYEASLPPGAWPNWVLGNHDRSRVATRIGPGQARVAAMLLLTLRGTPTIYQGEEIGMTDAPIPPELVQDPWEKNVPGLGLGRDPVRTPMQWDDSPEAGFTSGRPWLPVAADYEAVNVAIQDATPGSMLALYRRLIELRRSEPALSVGAFRMVSVGRDVMVYERRHDGRRITVALNLASAPREADLEVSGNRILLSTRGDRAGESIAGELRLRSDEGVILA